MSSAIVARAVDKRPRIVRFDGTPCARARFDDARHFAIPPFVATHGERRTVVRMFGKITVHLSPDRCFTAYVSGNHVEIVGTIDGHAAHFGSARWNGAILCDSTIRLRDDVLAQLNSALRAGGMA